MRIIAGEFKSRKLESLKGDITRPTLDKVKESIFNRIGPYFDEQNILDVFGGSGSIAFEFLSRGIQQATIIEREPQAQQIIGLNIKNLRVENRVKLMKMDSFKAIKIINESFDYIYIDPPYRFNKFEKLMKLLEPLTKATTLLLYESDSKQEPVEVENYDLIRTDIYGHTRVTHYRQKQMVSE